MVHQILSQWEREPATLQELIDAAVKIDNICWENEASHWPKDNKPSKNSTPNKGTSTGQHSSTSGKLQDSTNYVSPEERERCCSNNLCIKCSTAGHCFVECRTGWKATKGKDKGKGKEMAKVAKEEPDSKLKKE
ncbi:unnamed protein product [Rhizoctonia solani]|uniref:CCHC-type domain-containing protein n=1 Tax=Rhizoctonia solani TaxID=456999 RepID=A0A8H2WMR7_9AGAM|nr:unnamed protein product [Rhizoctonia solani]